MIIFDLDGTLADCEHRRHFVQRQHCFACGNNEAYGEMVGCICMKTKFTPDWKAFYEACDQDKPIEPVIEIFQSLIFENHIRQGKEIQIWSGRCESVREKTQAWLDKYVWGSPSVPLKMRPIGDNTPDDELKERWMLQYVYEANIKQNNPNPIDFVFDDKPKVIRMWRKYGIFVFNCAQHDEEF